MRFENLLRRTRTRLENVFRIKKRRTEEDMRAEVSGADTRE